MTYILNIYDVDEDQILNETLKDVNDLADLNDRVVNVVEHFENVYGTRFVVHSITLLGGID